jgi:hypothetical protein
MVFKQHSNNIYNQNFKIIKIRYNALINNIHLYIIKIIKIVFVHLKFVIKKK